MGSPTGNRSAGQPGQRWPRSACNRLLSGARKPSAGGEVTRIVVPTRLRDCGKRLARWTADAPDAKPAAAGPPRLRFENAGAERKYPVPQAAQVAVAARWAKVRAANRFLSTARGIQAKSENVSGLPNSPYISYQYDSY